MQEKNLANEYGVDQVVLNWTVTLESGSGVYGYNLEVKDVLLSCVDSKSLLLELLKRGLEKRMPYKEVGIYGAYVRITLPSNELGAKINGLEFSMNSTLRRHGIDRNKCSKEYLEVVKKLGINIF